MQNLVWRRTTITVFKNTRIYIIKDIILNLCATGISLIILQVILFPLMARKMSADNYGQMQTIISAVYLIGGTLGQALSTSRLLTQFRTSESNRKSSYQFLLYLSILVILIVMPIVCASYLNIGSTMSIIIITIIAILNCIGDYAEAGFRIDLKYGDILVARSVLCLGYVIGYITFCYFNIWELFFLIAFVLKDIYYFIRVKIIHEFAFIMPDFKNVWTSFFSLCLSNLMVKALTYFDKLLLYPILGGTAVSIYVTANLMGKLVLQILEPINNVILSYISRKNRITNTLWKNVLIVSSIFCIIAYFFCLIICKPIIMIFYPQWAEQTYTLLPITTLTLCISALTGILYPFSLKTIKISYQILINGICLVVYVISVLVLYKMWGLIGCCIALLISYIVKVFIIVYLCWRQMKSYAEYKRT